MHGIYSVLAGRKGYECHLFALLYFCRETAKLFVSVASYHPGSQLKKLPTFTRVACQPGMPPPHPSHPFNTSIKVQTALEGLPNIDNITVSATDKGPNGGRQWQVTFSGREVEGNVPIMTVDTAGLTGSGVTVDVEETRPGNEPVGRFMLQADTAPQGWPEHRSGWISVGSSAFEVAQAVTQVVGILAADVTVNASLPTVGPIAWEITFSHRQKSEVEVSEETGSTVAELGSFVPTGQSGDRPPLRVVRPQLSGSGARAEAETVHDGEHTIGGTYELYLRGQEATATAAVNAGASAADLRLALVEDLGLPGDIDVERAGPLDDSLAYTWTVTLPEGAGFAGDLIANASQLSGDGMSVVTSVVQAGSPPVGGEFKVSLTGEAGEEGDWVAVAHNATDIEVADAISSFTASGGNVSVSSEDIVQVDPGYPTESVVTGKRWEVTFSALAAAGDVPTIEVNGSSGLLTGAGASVFVNETSKGVSADIQEVTIDGYSGTFAFSFADDGVRQASNVTSSSTSSPVPWNATSSDLATALLEATGKRVYVERSPIAPWTGLNTGGYVWLVLFAEALNGTWDSVHLNTTNLVPDDDLLAGISRQANLTMVRNSTANAVGGGFSVRFGQRCDERAAGVYCTVAETEQLMFHSTPGEVEAALETLPAIIDAAVATDGDDDNIDASFWDNGVGRVAPDGFGVASAGARFRVAFSAVSFNASDSALAEYWRRTWVPENSATQWSGDFATGGDLPPLHIDVSRVTGSHAAARVEETTKGLSTEVGGVVAIEVSLNAGRDYTASGVTYVYEALVSVRALLPDHGPILGGTEVSVDVQRFFLTSEPTPVGLFSDARVRRQPHHAGNRQLRLNVLHPIHTNIHLQVLVLGDNFRHSSRLACQFGSSGVDARVTVPATFLNTSALLCISPPRLTPPAHPVNALATVEVTNNAAVGGSAAAWSTFSRSGVSFRYEGSPGIESVVPHLGPASGNFSVRVAGGPFPDTTELRYVAFTGPFGPVVRCVAGFLLLPAPYQKQKRRKQSGETHATHKAKNGAS